MYGNNPGRAGLDELIVVKLVEISSTAAICSAISISRD